ncbi:hypothetical protein LSH36_15g00001 [Paralvinella palmiformis]|uniref:Uncharacterized protein n=1 Tax=Paralvinella palmiformis TaxID=53620 RepID=A0AAD9NHM6_9ANNE|nr:hypothetical protein LSH36_15g00001 [Paralvinella palmiformis]
MESSTSTRLQEVCAALGDESPTAFGVNHAASIMAKWQNDGKKLTRRLLTDEEEFDFLAKDTYGSDTQFGVPQRCLIALAGALHTMTDISTNTDGHRGHVEFNLTADCILRFNETHQNRCAARDIGRFRATNLNTDNRSVSTGWTTPRGPAE